MPQLSTVDLAAEMYFDLLSEKKAGAFQIHTHEYSSGSELLTHALLIILVGSKMQN